MTVIGRGGVARNVNVSSRLAGLMLATALLVGLLPADVAHAAVRLEVPEESPGGPFYARAGGASLPPHTEEWAAIVFYRDPSCIPLGFNLLNFFDQPPRPFGCPLTVEGFEVWRNGPGQDLAPMQSELRDAGLVPVWFVSWPELQAAAAGGLTITELAALPSLITGYADQFKETLHPTQAGRNTAQHQMTASGTLSDGRSFRLQFTAVANPGNPVGPESVKHVAIEFR